VGAGRGEVVDGNVFIFFQETLEPVVHEHFYLVEIIHGKFTVPYLGQYSFYARGQYSGLGPCLGQVACLERHPDFGAAQRVPQVVRDDVAKVID